MSTTFICPHCGKQVEATEALRHQIEENIKKEYEESYKQKLEDIRIEEKSKAEQDLLLLREEKERINQELQKSRDEELKLRKERAQLEDEKRSLRLDVQRQVDEERKRIREEVYTKAQDEIKYKLLEKDKQLEDVKKSNDELRRKLEQGSQQLQGEVQELDLESTLRGEFPDDIVEPVGKGILGADIKQVARSPKGIVCGIILWESKRTKAWGNDWTEKLKKDMRADNANISAIVTEVLPEEIKAGIGLKDGVWVCNPKMIIPMAMLLRKGLLDCMRQKLVSENRLEKSDLVYDYITSQEFQNQVEGIIEVYKDIKIQIIKERMAFEKSWKEREKQSDKLLFGMSRIYGSIQGIAGSALPPVRSLELTDGESEKHS